MKGVDIAGQKFSKLKAIELVARSLPGRKPIWSFECECGKIALIRKELVTRHHHPIKSCGCNKRCSLESLQHSVFTASYTDGNLTEKEFITLTQLCCFWCGGDVAVTGNVARGRYNKNIIWKYHGLDRIDNDKPHDRDNVRPCCWDYNEMRGKRTELHFVDKITKIATGMYKRGQ